MKALSPGYVSFGLSRDARMGEDLTTNCIVQVSEVDCHKWLKDILCSIKTDMPRVPKSFITNISYTFFYHKKAIKNSQHTYTNSKGYFCTQTPVLNAGITEYSILIYKHKNSLLHKTNL